MDRWTRANNRLKPVAAGFGFAWVHLISFLANPIGKQDFFFSRRHMPLRLPRGVSAANFFSSKARARLRKSRYTIKVTDSHRQGQDPMIQEAQYFLHLSPRLFSSIGYFLLLLPLSTFSENVLIISSKNRGD
jgi:hypothetical protein